QFSADDISRIESEGSYPINIGPETIELELVDVEISSEDIPGWTVTSLNGNTVALDITITEKLAEEGLARELVNRIQNLRKDIGLAVTDRINISVLADQKLSTAISHNLNYICSETLIDDLRICTEEIANGHEIELVDEVTTTISINKN
ncbi:MAG: isoleucine--tRNA ligase, partial [Bacteroidetes bacterium]|nr:isoleucine--tRNA ligase [Bacteroidota bacterium]